MQFKGIYLCLHIIWVYVKCTAKVKRKSKLWLMWRGGEFIRVSGFSSRHTAGCFLTPRSMPTPGAIRELTCPSRWLTWIDFQVMGWRMEETRKHLFDNWVAPIESVNLWIRSVQFMNEFRPVLWTWFFNSSKRSNAKYAPCLHLGCRYCAYECMKQS